MNKNKIKNKYKNKHIKSKKKNIKQTQIIKNKQMLTDLYMWVFFFGQFLEDRNKIIKTLQYKYKTI